MRKFKLLGLEIAFAAGVYVVSGVGKSLDVFMLVCLSLAAFRMARTLSFNEVGEPLRAPFTKVVQDSCGAGENVHPKDGSVLGSLLACPICTGTWSALALYGLWCAWPDFGRVLIYVLAIAGAAEILHWGAELLEWSGRAGRCVSGLISPDNPSKKASIEMPRPSPVHEG